jgi:hypothetical protein
MKDMKVERLKAEEKNSGKNLAEGFNITDNQLSQREL